VTPARYKSSVADVMRPASALAALPYRRDLREAKKRVTLTSEKLIACNRSP
jgi:hypothetical protein